MALGTLTTRGRLVRDGLFVATLCGAIWLAYAPSLEQTPRADQWCYLLDTRDYHDFSELLRASYSYNRTRRMFPGDTELFRPVLFALLAVEKHWLENDFAAIQAIGIGLHCGIVLLLFALLVRVSRLLLPDSGAQPPWLPHAVTTFFALNSCTQELVLWAHLHGYLLFAALVLGSLLLLSEVLLRPDLAPGRRRWLLGGAWCLILLSAFTYELGQLFALAVAILLGGRELSRRRPVAALVSSAAFASILLLYQGANRMDKAIHSASFTPDAVSTRIFDRLASRDTLDNSTRFLKYTVVQPVFLSTVKPYVGTDHRLCIPETKWRDRLASRPQPLFFLSCGVFAVMTAATVRGGWYSLRQGSRRGWPVLLLLGSLFFGYGAMIVVGRLNLLPGNKEALARNSYYTYIALLFFLAGAFVVWLQAGACPPACGRITRGGFTLLATGLFALACVGGVKIHKTSLSCRKWCRPVFEVNQRMREFIASHRHEPDFRFTVAVAQSEHILCIHGVPLPMFLHAKWIDNHQPRYVLIQRREQLEVLNLAEYRQRFPESSGQINPDLIEIASSFNVFSCAGSYCALPRRCGWYDPRRPAPPALLTADSLTVLRERIAEHAKTGQR